jgi:hypothetical protein
MEERFDVLSIFRRDPKTGSDMIGLQSHSPEKAEISLVPADAAPRKVHLNIGK